MSPYAIDGLIQGAIAEIRRLREEADWILREMDLEEEIELLREEVESRVHLADHHAEVERLRAELAEAKAEGRREAERLDWFGILRLAAKEGRIAKMVSIAELKCFTDAIRDTLSTYENTPSAEAKLPKAKGDGVPPGTSQILKMQAEAKRPRVELGDE
jgi:hypothetical protein